MKTVAKFEKVSYAQFRKDWLDTFYNVDKTSIGIEEIENEIRNIYDNIKLPKRSTVGSAGYDFFFKKSDNHFSVTTGQAFCQGVFLPYGITEDDNATNARVGGFGSTDKNTAEV